MPALAVVVRQNVTGMNPSSVHGAMLTACSIRAMFTANVREQKFTVEACFEMVTPDGELDLVEESHLLHPDETEETL